MRYRAFVEGAIGEGLESPLKKPYGGMILRGSGFVKEALSRLKDGTVHREDISHGRELQTAFGSDDVLMALSDYLGVSRAEVSANNEHRKMAIYLLKGGTGLTNRQIGQTFGDISYSAVSKAYQRFSAELREDRRLGKDVERGHGSSVPSQDLTPPLLAVLTNAFITFSPEKQSGSASKFEKKAKTENLEHRPTNTVCKSSLPRSRTSYGGAAIGQETQFSNSAVSKSQQREFRFENS